MSHAVFKRNRYFISNLFFSPPDSLSSFPLSLGVRGVCWWAGSGKGQVCWSGARRSRPTQAKTSFLPERPEQTGPQQTAVTIWLHAGPPASKLSFGARRQEKLSPFMSEDGGGIRHMWTCDGLISCANARAVIWASSCKVASSSSAGPMGSRTAMWSTDGAAYGWLKVWKTYPVCPNPII